MSKEKPSSWQDLPTVVEITEESRRRNQNARNMAAILEDIVEADEPAGRPKGSAAAMPVDQLLSGFHFGGDDVPTLVQSAAPFSTSRISCASAMPSRIPTSFAAPALRLSPATNAISLPHASAPNGQGRRIMSSAPRWMMSF